MLAQKKKPLQNAVPAIEFHPGIQLMMNWRR